MHDEIVIAVQEPVVKVDNALHELWRKDSDAAIVEQIDSGRLSFLREHRVIAEMRIAVNDAEAAEWKPPRGEHGGRQGVTRFEGIVFVREHARALEPIEREQAAG